MLRASALQRWAMSTGRRLVSRPAPNVTAPDCVIVQDCDKLVGILMLMTFYLRTHLHKLSWWQLSSF